MSVTYTDTTHDAVADQAYVPVYARKRAARGRAGAGGLKTWMILAPLGLVVVGGVTAAMLLNGGEAEVAPAPVAAPAPAVSQAPLTDMMAAPAADDGALSLMRPADAAPAPVPAVQAPAPTRATAPVQRRAPAAPVETPTAAATDAGDAATADLNRAQAARTGTAPTITAAPTPTAPRAPSIEVQPFPGQ